jgi:hypothetical protein
VCNDGDLALLQAASVDLSGCGGAVLSVDEIVPGTKEGFCPLLDGDLCSYVHSAHGNYPLKHIIRDLELGTEYFVQAQYRSENGYSIKKLATPASFIPRHNGPSSQPPPFLIESTSTSITVGWEAPNSNGGAPISGYELWMDDLSGADNVLVYDGIGKPEKRQFEITTKDAGPLSQIVESGRQYRFQVRAVNQCRSYIPQNDAPCYGPFSESQIFTVRDPRAPQPPSAPLRDSRSGGQSLMASITISWSRPLDNGGSPVTGYIMYMKDSNGSISSFPLSSSDMTRTVDDLNEGEIYSFYVVALNEKGRSGNSPSLTVIAATYPGLGNDFTLKDYQEQLQPKISDVDETSMVITWNRLHDIYNGGSAITGYKLYMYEGVNGSLQDTAQQEIQHLTFSGFDTSVGGTFTVSYRGFQTDQIPAEASSQDLQRYLSNLDSINTVQVNDIQHGWAVTFLSEVGDLPLMEVTKGRLTGPQDFDLTVSEYIKGDVASLVFDGSDRPTEKVFTVTNLISGGHCKSWRPVVLLSISTRKWIISAYHRAS